MCIRDRSKANPWQWQICRGIKDTIPFEKKKGVVYEIRCSECPASYIGETACSLITRKKEHERNTRLAQVEMSAVAEHVWLNDHKIHWAETSILDSEANFRSRRVKEAIWIALKSPSLNRDSGLELSQLWIETVRKNSCSL